MKLVDLSHQKYGKLRVIRFLGVLILPTLVPVLLWAWFNRPFLANLSRPRAAAEG